MRYIYCHPLFDERKCAHRFSYQLRNIFESAGLNLERFDYRGTGEANGDFKNVLLETLYEDTTKHINGDEVSLIGLRFGATVALDYYARNPGVVTNLVLLEPIIDGSKYVDYLYRKQHIKDLMTGKPAIQPDDNGYINIEGYKTNRRLIEQIKNLDLLKKVPKKTVDTSVLIVQIPKQSQIRPEITCLAEQLISTIKQMYIDNIDLPTFWERIPISDYSKLIKKILRWCL